MMVVIAFFLSSYIKYLQ